MKSRSLSLIVTLILLIAIGGVFAITQLDTTRPPHRSNEPIPYIYYYSDLEHAFVIERADGTDSRLLAQGVMPEDHNVIDSVHWSPSGEYLAWRSHRHNGPGAYYVSGWLASSDGTHVSDLLDDARDVYLMEWAPDKDWLVVGFQGTWLESHITIRVIDVPGNRIVTELTSNGLDWMDQPASLSWRDVWADDGSAVYFIYGQFRGTTVSKIGLNGIHEQWYFDNCYPCDPLYNFSEGRLFESEYFRRDGQSYQDYLITDLTTGESRVYETLPSSESPDMNYDIVWNNNATYSIVIEQICEVDDNRHRQCETTTLTLFDWETGEKFDLPDNLRIPRHDYAIGDDPWSPDGSAAMLQNEEGNLYFLDTHTHEISDINTVNQWLWTEGRDFLTLDTDDSGDNLLLSHNWQTDHFNTDSYPVQRIELVPRNFSPDFSFIGYTHLRNVTVQNILTGELYE